MNFINIQNGMLAPCMIALALLVSSCGNVANEAEISNSLQSTETGIFEDFKYPEKYAKIVERAEAGTKNDVLLMVDYYSNFPSTDLRNLEYWSNKAVKYDGPSIYTNLIVALVSHNQCEKAWKILDEHFANPSSFPFYSSVDSAEMIDEKCRREKMVSN